jgi:hypothetical protein
MCLIGSGIVGVPEFDRPCVDITVTQTCWQIMAQVTSALKQKGLSQAAQEFRQLATECDDDPGMLFTLALVFITVPGQEPTS